MRPARILKPLVRAEQRPRRVLVELSGTEPSRAVSSDGGLMRVGSIGRRCGRAALLLLGLLILMLGGFRIAALLRESATPEAIAPSAGQFVATSGGQMFLQDQGPRDRVPIVLLHGTAAWSEFWRGTIDHLLSKGHRVVALDLPPFGFSERSPTGAYTRADQAKRIIGALDALNIRRAVFVGHSFGAGATVEAVMRHSDRVAGLVLVAAALGLPADGPIPEASPGAADMFLRLPILPEVVVSATLTNPLLTQRLLAMMVERKEAATSELAEILRRPMTRQNTTRDFVSWVRGFISPDIAAISMSPSNYKSLAVPTGIVWGERDSLTPLSQGQRLASLIAGSEMAVLPGVGHIPQIEDPVAFRAALDRMLSKLAPGTPRQD